MEKLKNMYYLTKEMARACVANSKYSDIQCNEFLFLLHEKIKCLIRYKLSDSSCKDQLLSNLEMFKTLQDAREWDITHAIQKARAYYSYPYCNELRSFSLPMTELYSHGEGCFNFEWFDYNLFTLSVSSKAWAVSDISVSNMYEDLAPLNAASFSTEVNHYLDSIQYSINCIHQDCTNDIDIAIQTLAEWLIACKYNQISLSTTQLVYILRMDPSLIQDFFCNISFSYFCIYSNKQLFALHKLVSEERISLATWEKEIYHYIMNGDSSGNQNFPFINSLGRKVCNVENSILYIQHMGFSEHEGTYYGGSQSSIAFLFLQKLVDQFVIHCITTYPEVCL